MIKNRILFAFCALTVLLFSACGAKKDNYISHEELLAMSQNYALVVAYPDGTVKAYNGRGLSPIFNHLENNDFKNAHIYDKVTGRASSLLLAYGGAAKLHTGMLSKEAIEILNKYGIEYSADKQVDHILNRSKTGSCPMETAARPLNDANAAFPILKESYNKLISSGYDGK